MSRIAFVSNLYFPHVVGGAELALQTLAEQLARTGNEVHVVTLSVADSPAREAINGVHVHRIVPAHAYGPFAARKTPAARLLWHARDVHDLGTARQVGEIVDALRPDVVSTHNLAGLSVAVWDLAHARGIPVLHTLHDYYLLCPRVTMFKASGNCTRQCAACFALSIRKRRASRHVAAVVGVSRFILEAHLRRGFFPHATREVIYNARRWLRVASAPGPRASGRLAIGFMGRLEAAKGIEVLLAAASGLVGEDWELRIAGRAPDPAYAQELRRRYPLPRAHYLGFVEAEEFYRSIDVLVIPSTWHEPLGMVAYEAMTFGRPVIAARSGGLPEVVAASGAGWLFGSGDVGELREILARLIAAPAALDAKRELCLERSRSFAPEYQAREFLALVARCPPRGRICA